MIQVTDQRYLDQINEPFRGSFSAEVKLFFKGGTRTFTDDDIFTISENETANIVILLRVPRLHSLITTTSSTSMEHRVTLETSRMVSNVSIGSVSTSLMKMAQMTLCGLTGRDVGVLARHLLLKNR